MAEITKEDVEYVAGLAQLTLNEATKEHMVSDLGKILTYMEKLNELDTENVEPMLHVLELTNVTREDVALPSLDHDAALENAPKTDGQYFLVPRILDAD